MKTETKELIIKAYNAFNSRDINKALTTFHAKIEWPRAFEGGYVKGHDEIRAYWTIQWSEIDPTVKPIGFTERTDGTIEVKVQQEVKDLEGKTLFDGVVKHIYTLEDDLLKKMDIETD